MIILYSSRGLGLGLDMIVYFLSGLGSRVGSDMIVYFQGVQGAGGSNIQVC